ncbi:hypothetical protein BDV23DRAFT_172383 [Aspergillus alliaceus]|uniref:Hydroxyacyl dehydrogenase n=1 Tax=Petromyces alliaceus TaxID=209559 RepID=A0A5N7C8B7_PETAA|nr:hypothetical protein BDV23DRAFT_172383 [Aspergillus alliaceus]
MTTYLITGSSRGLGLTLVKELVSRDTAEVSLVIVKREAGRAVFISLDVSNESSISSCAGTASSVVGQKGVDGLINCAGVHSETHGERALMSDLDYQLSVNFVGAHNMTRAFLPLLRKGALKKVAKISSVYASMTKAELSSFAPCPAYKISKAALNALTVQYAMSYKDEGYVFLAWLRTDMGGGDAHLTAVQEAQAVLKVVEKAEKDSNGCSKNIDIPGWDIYDRKDIAW